MNLATPPLELAGTESASHSSLEVPLDSASQIIHCRALNTDTSANDKRVAGALCDIFQ